MKTSKLLSLAALSIVMASGAFAADVSGTPRVDQVNKRIDKQESRIDAGVSKGTITPEQAAKDQEKLDKDKAVLAKDESEHNGHITKAEQKHLNKKLDHSSKRIKKQAAK